MKAPDKIYIDKFSAFATEPVKDGEEYIRKDALLEWLEKRLYEVGIASTIHIIDVIDKLNSM